MADEHAHALPHLIVASPHRGQLCVARPASWRACSHALQVNVSPIGAGLHLARTCTGESPFMMTSHVIGRGLAEKVTFFDSGIDSRGACMNRTRRSTGCWTALEQVRHYAGQLGRA
jgi:hypothetical protein